jgi:uncharacterized membrane protein YfcA
MELSFFATIALWGVLAGVVFSSIGAAGGILVSFTLISVVGVADPNSVKPMTQIVVLATALIFIPGYFRRSALVWPLGLLLAGGGLLGAWMGSSLSSAYLTDMGTFRPVFGVLTLVIAAQIAWRRFQSWTAPDAGQPGKDKANSLGVSSLSLSGMALTFSYGERGYRVPMWSPFLAGFLIAAIAAVFGVGGGFLLVPYMSTLLHMPMHIIPATSGIAIMISLLMSIGNYLALGAELDIGALVPLAVGAVIGAVLGPFVNRWMKHSWLCVILFVIVSAIGLRYLLA